MTEFARRALSNTHTGRVRRFVRWLLCRFWLHDRQFLREARYVKTGPSAEHQKSGRFEFYRCKRCELGILRTSLGSWGRREIEMDFHGEFEEEATSDRDTYEYGISWPDTPFKETPRIRKRDLPNYPR